MYTFLQFSIVPILFAVSIVTNKLWCFILASFCEVIAVFRVIWLPSCVVSFLSPVSTNTKKISLWLRWKKAFCQNQKQKIFCRSAFPSEFSSKTDNGVAVLRLSMGLWPIDARLNALSNGVDVAAVLCRSLCLSGYTSVWLPTSSSSCVVRLWRARSCVFFDFLPCSCVFSLNISSDNYLDIHCMALLLKIRLN